MKTVLLSLAGISPVMVALIWGAPVVQAISLIAGLAIYWKLNQTIV